MDELLRYFEFMGHLINLVLIVAGASLSWKARYPEANNCILWALLFGAALS